MAEFDSSQALFFMGGGEQTTSDLHHVYTSIDIAAGMGHIAEVEQLWLRTDRPIAVHAGDEVVTTSVLTEAAGEVLAQIELRRYETVDPQLLSARERHLRGLLGGLGGGFSHDVGRSAFGSAIRGLGGVAVIGGTELAINIAAGNYEDLRQLGR